MASAAEVTTKDHQLNGKLYRALMKEDDEKVKELCKEHACHALHILTIHKDTVLHKATYAKQTSLVLELLNDLPDHLRDRMTIQNCTGNTILHEAATLNRETSVEIAGKMLEKAPDLLSMTNELGETALFRAARYGKKEIFNFLAEKLKECDEATWQPSIQRNDKTTILHAAVLSRHFGLALEIARGFKHIIGEEDDDGMTPLQHLSCDPAAFETVRRRGLLKRISIPVSKCCSSARGKKVPKEESSSESALKLAKYLVKEDTSWETTSSAIDMSKTKRHGYRSSSNAPSIAKGDDEDENGESEEEQHSSFSRRQKEHGRVTPLFLATKFGCIEIVEAILKKYPQAVEHIDEKGRTILHVAIKYRQLEVFNLVLEMEVPMRWLIRRLDKEGNSILHMVGMKRSYYLPERLRGPALELQEELLWFERVKSVTKTHFVDHRNNEKQTAEGLFASTYKDLRNEARDWLKHTAEGCSIVAVLIATVAFAAAYTVPGGPRQDTGYPVLLYQPFFVVFTATDVLSLACALTSVVIFLSILTAPFRMDDFKQSLPNKLLLGITFLFLSVSMMMISFSATIILMIRRNERWTKVILYSLSFLPVIIFALSYIPLYVSLSKTYRYLFEKIRELLPSSVCFPGPTICSNRPQPQDTDSAKLKSEKDFNWFAAP